MKKYFSIILMILDSNMNNIERRESQLFNIFFKIQILNNIILNLIMILSPQEMNIEYILFILVSYNSS